MRCVCPCQPITEASFRPESVNASLNAFFAGAGARRMAAGAGLGLYVARKIAQAHAGSLELEE